MTRTAEDPSRGRPLRVLQVNTHDLRGGAAGVAWSLHRAYVARGLTSCVAVKRKESSDPGVEAIPNEVSRPWPVRVSRRLAHTIEADGRMGRVAARRLRVLAEPDRWRDVGRGVEDFDFPGTKRLLELFPEPPDLVHCHNLHGGFFDLRVLPWLSRRVPLVLTFHDAWLLSGHCAHSAGCARWRHGCGDCPDLTLPPAVPADATAENWRRKRDIFAEVRFYATAPCRWLMDRVGESLLASSALEGRVIPHGVDLDVFHPGQRDAARHRLGLPPDAFILLMCGDHVRTNAWKDLESARTAVGRASAKLEGRSRVVLVALGEEGSDERAGSADIRFLPHVREREVVADHYRAADLYLHPSRADTFPSTVLEALACGTPVVASAVGGIPEQVASMTMPGAAGRAEMHPESGPTGMLVEQGDVGALTAAIVRLARDAELRRAMGRNAARSARLRFNVERQVDEYLAWYAHILNRENRGGADASFGGKVPASATSGLE